MKLNEIKCITTPFLSGLCYGPVHVGVYGPWTFVVKFHLSDSSPLILPPPLDRLLLYLLIYGQCCGSLVVAFYLSWVVCCRPLCLWGWMRLLLETLDIRVRHSCACMRTVMATDCACFRSGLYIRAFGGFSLNETGWAISARMRV